MDTFGSLVDKLATVNQKMFINQELIYEIRRMSFEQFVEKYFREKSEFRKLYEGLHKCCDLNIQRNTLIEEVDRKLLEIVSSGKVDVQPAHKTY